jgi:SOS-response transcriptional repressor LexA
MITGERLAFFRSKAGHTQESLAVASGISRKRISEIEGDKGSPSLDTLEALLKACNVSLAEFFFSELQNLPTKKEHRDIYDKIELLLKDPADAKFVGRLVQSVFDNAITSHKEHLVSSKERESHDESLIREDETDLPREPVWVMAPVYGDIIMGDPEETGQQPVDRIPIVHTRISKGQYILRARGDSMSPVFESGDLLLIDNKITAKPGDYVAALLNHRTTLKQLIKDKQGRLILHPLNPKYKDRTIVEGDELRIQGVVLEIVRRKIRR